MNWQTDKLGRLAEFRNGINFSSSNYGKGIKVIGVADFQNYSVPKFDQLGEINPEGIVRPEDLLQEGDIVFVRSNGNRALVGRSLHIKNLHEKVTHSGFTIRLRFTSPKAFAPFFAQLFRSEIIRQELSYFGSGTNISNLSQESLKNIGVPVPPLSEQRKIADILSTWDEAISKTEELIAALQTRKKGLMQRLLTGEVRFEGFNDEWKKYRLDRIGAFLKGSGISKSDLVEDGIPCVRYGEIYTTHDFVIKEFHSFITQEIASASKRIFAGDILFAGSGETADEIGKCVAFIGKEEAYAGGDLIILRLTKGDPVYMGYLLNHESVKRQKYRFGQGYSVVHIYARYLKEIVILLPSIEEQKKIARVLLDCDAEIDLYEKKLAALQQQKKGLMQRLLTGQVRVKV